MLMCFALYLEDDAVRLFGLTAALKQPLKIGGYADSQSLRICVSAYPLNVNTYPGIHLVNIFKNYNIHCVSAYPHIHF